VFKDHILQLNHLNLAVVDVLEAQRFFETFFEFRCVDTKGADTLAVLEGAGGFTLVLSHLDKTTKPVYPKDFHVGFILDSPEQVQKVFDQLQNAGVELPHPPREMRGSLIFYCHVLDAILLEVSCPVVGLR
jgi:catechol 2,3-dioxygenase-like lactoylglutathione lyase family enzyme